MYNPTFVKNMELMVDFVKTFFAKSTQMINSDWIIDIKHIMQ